MTVDVSQLAIEVTTKGIKEASDALGSKGLARSAENADRKVKSLTDNLGRLMGAFPGVTGSATALSGAMGHIVTALGLANVNATATARALAQVTAGMTQMTAATHQGATALDRKARSGGTVLTTLKAMTTAFALYAGFNFAKSIISSADAWQLMQARLTTATGSLNNARVAQQQIFEVSQKLRQPLEATTQLYTRLAPVMARMGKTSTDTIKVVEGAGMAMKISGTTAGEAASAMLQLSQSFNAGRLNGQEFNSIAEAAPKLLEAIAVKMKVTRAELKELGSQNKITGQIMADAIRDAAPVWEEQFKKLPITAADAFTRVENAWKKAMGELGEDTGVNRDLAKSIMMLEKLIPLVRDELIVAFTGVMHWIKSNETALGEMWAQAKGLVVDVWEIGAAMGFVVRQTLGAGESFSLVGFAIYSVRLAIAGVQDGLMLIGALVMKLGANIIKNMLAPLSFIVTEILSTFMDRLSWIFETLGSGAKFVGLKQLGEGLSNLGAEGRNTAQFVRDLQSGFEGVGKSLSEAGDNVFQMLSDGEGAVGRLLSGQEQVTREMEKQKKLKYDENFKTPGPVVDEKAQKKAAKELQKIREDANDELKKSIALQKEMEASLAQLEKYGLEGDKRTKAQKEITRLTEESKDVADRHALAVIQEAIATHGYTEEIENERDALLELLRAKQKHTETMDARIKAENDEAIALERKVATYGMAKGEIEKLALAEEELHLVTMKNNAESETAIAQQIRLVEAMKRRQTAAEDLGGLETLDKLEKMLDPSKAERFGNVLGEAFGKAGKAADGLVKSMEKYGKREADIEKKRKEIEKYKSSDVKKYDKLVSQINEEEARDRIRSYGDMAGAAKDFFEEGTTGYKVMSAAEKAFRAYEMALAMESFLQKSGLLSTLTTLVLGNNAAQAISAQTSAQIESAAKMQVAGANAVGAVANQGNGDPYTAFARIAAMAAIMAGLGLMSGGGGGASSAPNPNSAAERQKRQGTGTVLGDDQAKSESIANALERMRDNSNIGLTYTSEMLASLRNIDLKMGGLTASISRASGLTTGLNFGVQEGTKGGGLFSSAKSTSIDDTGLILNGRMSDLQNGQGLQQFLDVTKTKSNWWSGTKTSHSRQSQGVDGELSSFIGGIFKDINDTIITAGTSLGLSGDEMQRRLNEFVLSAEISLKDLRGEDLEKALQAFFSASADQLAQFAASQFTMFQRAGEGYFETLTRVATSTERAKDAMSKLGINMVSLWDVTNRTGDLDVELVRESLMRAEVGTTLANIVRLLDGSMEDLISNYRELTRVRNAMQSMGLDGNALSLDLIRGAGGIRELAGAFDTYVDNFFSTEEQMTMKMSQLNMEFARLGVAVPQSRSAFRSLVTELMSTGPAGQELAGRILSLSETFSEAMDLYDDTTGERITSARDALREAYDRESEALANTRDKMQGFADSLREFKDELVMSDLSPLSTMEKYQTALSRYEDVSTRALGGDEAAIAEFQNVANELLRFSREVNASGENYMSDFNRVLSATQLLEQYTQGQADQAQTELSMLQRQVESLISIDETVKTVAEAMAELLAVMGGGSTTPVLTDVVTDAGTEGMFAADTGLTDPAAPSVPTQAPAAAQAASAQRSTENMLSELQSLRTEIRTLREQQAAEAAAQRAATYDANDQAADKIVVGVGKASEDTDWRRNYTPGLV